MRNIYKDKKIINNISQDYTNKQSLNNDPADIIENKDKLRILQIALNEVKPIYKKIIEFKYYDGLTHKEIAEKINKSKDASESLLQWTVGAVKKELNKLSKFM